MKKLISMLLTLSLVFGLSASAFAAEATEFTDVKLAEKIAAGISSEDIPTIEPNNNRFRYHYETTDKRLMSTAKITEDDIKSLEKVKDIAYAALGAGGLLGVGTAISIEVADAVYGAKKPGKIEYWRSTKKKIKTNVVTGNKSVVGEWWYITAKCYDTKGNVYATKTTSYRKK